MVVLAASVDWYVKGEDVHVMYHTAPVMVPATKEVKVEVEVEMEERVRGRRKPSIIPVMIPVVRRSVSWRRISVCIDFIVLACVVMPRRGCHDEGERGRGGEG